MGRSGHRLAISSLTFLSCSKTEKNIKVLGEVFWKGLPSLITLKHQIPLWRGVLLGGYFNAKCQSFSQLTFPNFTYQKPCFFSSHIKCHSTQWCNIFFNMNSVVALTLKLFYSAKGNYVLTIQVSRKMKTLALCIHWLRTKMVINI